MWAQTEIEEERRRRRDEKTEPERGDTEEASEVGVHVGEEENRGPPSPYGIQEWHPAWLEVDT